MKMTFIWKVYVASGLFIGEVGAADKTQAMQVARSWYGNAVSTVECTDYLSQLAWLMLLANI